MRIVCVGGGPASLFFAILMKKHDPGCDVTVYERNQRGDTFGFGVVFSDETLANVAQSDPDTIAAIESEFRYWSAMDVRYRGRTITSDGHGFAALSRVRLLDILAGRAEELGVKVKFGTSFDIDASEIDSRGTDAGSPDADLPDARRPELDLAGVDLIVAGDGVNSATRALLHDRLRPTITHGQAKYIWTATAAPFDRFTFIFEDTPHGVVQAHVYPFDDTRSTFIVEMAEATWHKAGLGGHDAGLALGSSDDHALAWCSQIFKGHLGGCGLIGNNSRWISFPRVSCESWVAHNVVLLGDACHTAHYSVGSGTKMALEDAIALAEALTQKSAARGDATTAQPAQNRPANGRPPAHNRPNGDSSAHDEPSSNPPNGRPAADDVADALKRYEAQRRPAVESLQRAAATSEDWFCHVDHHSRRPFEQFAFSLFTRSQRVTYDNLRERDPEYLDAALSWFASTRPQRCAPPTAGTPPIFYPFALREVSFPNRIGVSPMAQYSAVDGTPNDWHKVHLGSRAVGGAGLVMTEMTCTSPDARITPGCTGIWNDQHTQAWAQITAFVHEHTEARIGLQIGHAGRKGATKVPWEEMDAPLDDGGWPLISASALPYRHDSQTPAQMSYAQMDRVTEDFVAAAERAALAGFDLIEIHAAHGYLLSSFLSPVTNRRDDDHGGDLAGRARFPLRVVEAVRQAWPPQRPLSVRISATDWLRGGFGRSEAIELAHWLKHHGVDIIDVSTGQVDPAESPAYGRLYQTPFAEAIRNAADIPTMAVGAISSIDDVNTVLLAGRADLCLIARGHLVDPYWTLNAAIDLGHAEQPWPRQYWPGRTSRRRAQVPEALIDRDLR